METANKQYDDGMFKAEALTLTQHSLDTMSNWGKTCKAVRAGILLSVKRNGRKTNLL
jgi:hypothetical protein